MGSVEPLSSLPHTKPTTLPKPWRHTPLVESTHLSKTAGCRIFLKLDTLQPSGSFKSRGVGNVVLQAVRRHRQSDQSHRSLHFYSSSGGNAGLAAVTAATALGYPSSVVVPETTDAVMVRRIREAGASEVIAHGPSWQFADQHLREVVMKRRSGDGDGDDEGEVGVHVPPFDHEDIWDGNATIVDEVAQQLRTLDGPDSGPPDAIICSVGGGGLFCGIMRGAERNGWLDDGPISQTPPPAAAHLPPSSTAAPRPTQVLAVETSGADSLSQSLAAGTQVTLKGITSIAKSLGAVRVADRAFALAHRNPRVTSVVLSDAVACQACWRLAEDERLLVEPACGVSVALCYDPERLKRLVPGLTRESRVVVVVCGGSDVSVEKLEGWKGVFGGEWT